MIVKEEHKLSTLGHKLWQEIESVQGFAYIADDILDMTDDQVLAIAIAAHYHTQVSLKILRQFIKENTQITAAGSNVTISFEAVGEV